MLVITSVITQRNKLSFSLVAVQGQESGLVLERIHCCWTQTKSETQLRRPSPLKGANVLFGDRFKLPPLTRRSGVMDGALILQRN